MFVSYLNFPSHLLLEPVLSIYINKLSMKIQVVE